MRSENWRIILSITILAIFCALSFVFIAWAACSFLRNSLQTKKITLLFALIGVAIFGFLVVVYYLNDRQRWKYTKSNFSNVGGVDVMYLFFILAFVFLGLALLNALFSLLGSLLG